MDLSGLSLMELREKAKDLGIKSAYKYKKAELIDIILEALPSLPMEEPKVSEQPRFPTRAVIHGDTEPEDLSETQVESPIKTPIINEQGQNPKPSNSNHQHVREYAKP